MKEFLGYNSAKHNIEINSIYSNFYPCVVAFKSGEFHFQLPNHIPNTLTDDISSLPLSFIFKAFMENIKTSVIQQNNIIKTKLLVFSVFINTIIIYKLYINSIHRIIQEIKLQIIDQCYAMFL